MSNSDANNQLLVELIDEQATVRLGNRLADLVLNGNCIHLHGDLGAGKTTLTRGFVTAKGHTGNVKSPTYTLVEPYELANCKIFHFDLYRLADPEELEFMGIRDYLDGNAICLVEWPEKGVGVLANPDLSITMQYKGDHRCALIEGLSPAGQTIMNKLQQ